MTDLSISNLLDKSLKGKFLNLEESLYLYKKAQLDELLFIANEIRKKIHPHNFVSYIVDRNINYTNICYSQCKFCNFCRKSQDKDAYVLYAEDLREKIDELYNQGGNQILLQGGMNPNLDLSYYIDLFSSLKKIYPDLKLHALGPPEIVFIAKRSGKSFESVLRQLIDAGLDSLPGAGAEILSDRVKKRISPAKCTVSEWLQVMRISHKLGITTSATMMFGHIETIEERMEHLIKLRDLQSAKPNFSKGFISFTAWPFAEENTILKREFMEIKPVVVTEFIRMIAISRIILLNIPNIQVSWLTMGVETASVALSAGANDLSSIMIEENVLSQAGKRYKITELEIRDLIVKAGFIPVKRDQEYNFIENNN